MKLATPTEGLMTLSEKTNPYLFSFAKVGLGSLGVVTELTLKCIPKHSLLEHTFSLPRSHVHIDHYNRLENYRHVRYMWLPYTSQVVSVVSNLVDAETKQPVRPDPAASIVSDFSKTKNTSGQNSLPTQPFIDALKEHYHKVHVNDSSALSKWSEKEENYRKLSFSQLRDELLELDPLNVSRIKSLNQAESKFWELSTGSRVDDSTNILGFDCGGEQFVYEICFPIGTLKEKSMKDIEFMNKLLHLIEINQIPAPCPIEHRWTSRSTSKMSPAYSENPEDVFAWIGIIMYIPKHANNDDMKSHENLREEIRSQFMKYMNLIQPLCEEYHATVHWAKIEIPHYVPLTEKEKAIYQKSLQKESGGLNWLWSLFSSSDSSKQIVEEFNTDGKLINNLRKRIHSRYPIEQFNRYRYALDPKHMFSNQIIDVLFAPYVKDNESSQQQQTKK
jgi:L-galactono-1,4-lactone dehydrogenase